VKNTIVALSLGLLLAACQQGTETDSKTAKQEEAKSADNKTLIADKDKMAYALGADMGNSVNRINDEYKAVAMDVEVVKQGFIDALTNQSAMNDEERLQQMQIFQQKLRFAQQQIMEQARAEKVAENATYLANLEAEGFSKTESGLFFKEIEAAKEGAAKPTETDTVKVHYTGTLTDGNQFDSSVERGPFEFSLKGGVIQGWLEGVKLMGVGSKYQFVIPPELGYGDRGNARIPASSILVFDIELLEIVTPESTK